jgi:membrane protease YdiL (CAAX protease family)
VALLRWLTRARAYQFGLGTPAWPRDLTIGYLGWLVATPAVFLIFAALLAVLEACGQHPNLQHPIETMLRTTADPAVWALAVVSATVAAPVVEELVFRGLLLRWLTDRRAVADGLLVVLLLAIATVGLAGVMNGRESAKPVLALLMPVGPGYLLFERLTARRLPRPGAARAIYVTALAFALIHDWPTPVPLFFLGLALGFVGYRTQGLIAPVVLHSLFNAVSVLGILLDLARKAAG